MDRTIQVHGIDAEVPESPLFSFTRYPDFVATDVSCPTSIEPIERTSSLFAAVALAEWTRKWQELEAAKFDPGDFADRNFRMDHARRQAYRWMDIYKISSDAESGRILRANEEAEADRIRRESDARLRAERGEKP